MPMTAKDRATRVVVAIVELADAIDAATSALETFGPSDERTLQYWERVEKAGAIVHRQSRLLAGKSKGG